MAQIRLERCGGGVLKGVGRDIGAPMRGVEGGNGLAETDNGERLILEKSEVYQSLGVVSCHNYISCQAVIGR